MEYGTACILHKGTQILLQERLGDSEDIHQNHWVPPGGHTEPGEVSLDCILREFPEETGLTIKNPQFRARVHFNNQGRTLHGEPYAGGKSWTVDFYDALEFEGELKSESPKIRHKWIEQLDLPQYPMHSGDILLLDLLLNPNNANKTYSITIRYDEEALNEFHVSEL